jgi:aminopeptidase N
MPGTLNAAFQRQAAFLIALTAISMQAFGQLDTTTDAAADQQTVNMAPITITPDSGFTARDYRGAYPRINDLVDTRLEVRFDFNKKHLNGKEWVTLQPHFYPTDSLALDAKGMDIHEVDLLADHAKIPLKYEYDGLQLRIRLDKSYTRSEKYRLYIDYTSKPDEIRDVQGSAVSITDKGLYFINPDGKEPYKPTEVWTQGETQSSSFWFPTIDEPDQKTLEEITMTVRDGFTSLSNGTMISSRKNADGTHTDTWKMVHPNSPYLFMMAAGPFVVVKDHWKNIPVDYYVEKAYAPYALDIFGHTPAMIDFYSSVLGVPYQWSKYDQVVARDYVSGAMENTTATLHGEFLYKTRRQLLDDDYANESVIAHELFHHWFGDLVTCESWSNLTLNESFADFSETLWAEHEYGKDLGDAHSFSDMQQYFMSAGGNDHPLVDYYYKNRDDVFDGVTYQKGGTILNMLRHVVGNDAFFRSLQYYLEQHKFQPAQVADLQLAFEHVTGKDLHWFFNQWYYGQGFPRLDISYQYLDHLAKVVITQKQQGQVFELPFAIDVYAGGKAERHWVNMMDRTDTFSFAYQNRPDLINVDAEKYLLVQKTDHKTLENWIYQFYHAPLFLDRREAIMASSLNQSTDSNARKVMLDALRDPYYGLRDLAEENLRMFDIAVRTAALPLLQSLALGDPNSGVRAGALTILEDHAPSQTYPELIGRALRDSSYKVEAAALTGLVRFDTTAALQQARAMEHDAYSPLSEIICNVLAKYGDGTDFPFVHRSLSENGSFSKFSYLNPFLSMLAIRIRDDATVKEGIDEIKHFGMEMGPQYGGFLVTILQNFVNMKKASAGSASDPGMRSALNDQANYGAAAALSLHDSITGR